MDGVLCSCGKISQHKVSTSPYGKGDTKYLCCECHVKDGGSPADWHPDCMKAYEKLKE